ncbi:MAG: hypothetical protein K2X03_06165 [Bryobacteraceae bacterium]|nr:hypothetical protein [Bryobacteraceae bacterium]
MRYLAGLVFPDLKNDRIQSPAHPSDRHKLLWAIAPLVNPVGLLKEFYRLLEANATAGIRAEQPTFAWVKSKPHFPLVYHINLSLPRIKGVYPPNHAWIFGHC